MTANMTKLTEDATAAGYEVFRDGTATVIRKYVKLNKSKKTRVAGLIVYEGGTAFRLDVDLSVAAGIRSFADMRSSLGLPADAAAHEAKVARDARRRVQHRAAYGVTRTTVNAIPRR